MASVNPLTAITEALMERMKKKHPEKEFYKKRKDLCEKPKRKRSRRTQSSLH